MDRRLAGRVGFFAVAAVVAWIAAPQAAWAADSQPAVFGPGFGACGEWTAAHRGYTAITASQDAWLLGYLSGYGAWAANRGNDPFGNTDNATFIAWVSNYCGAHPQDRIATAARALTADLNRRGGIKR